MRPRRQSATEQRRERDQGAGRDAQRPGRRRVGAVDWGAGGGRGGLRIRLEHQQHQRSQECNRWCVWLIVCENALCEPGQEQYPHTHRGRPAWYLANDGEWLAACMDARDAHRECRCGKPLPLIGTAGRPARYCSETCRRAADAARKARERAA